MTAVRIDEEPTLDVLGSPPGRRPAGGRKGRGLRGTAAVDGVGSEPAGPRRAAPTRTEVRVAAIALGAPELREP
jgi:hypothetical protein